ncbi:MAG: hotdog fold thioesterase [Enterobacteriaceae bacterium]
MIWQRQISLEQLNENSHDTISEQLGIEFTTLGSDYLIAEMPVDHRTRQRFGLLHGGASVVLAETLGSVAGYLCSEPGEQVVGIEVNANHLHAVRQGKVRGECRALFLGGRQQVWQIMIYDQQERLCCVSRLTTLRLREPLKKSG